MCDCDEGYVCRYHRRHCATCNAPLGEERKVPLCDFHEGAYREAGRQLREADRQRKEGF